MESRKINSKKGATCVFITMILTSMVFAVTVIGNAAFEKLKESEIDSVLRIAARSVLGEFDLRLKNDYGIFAYKATADEVGEKLEEYSSCSLAGSCRKMNASEVKVEVKNIDYSLLDCDVLKEQLVLAGRLSTIKRRTIAREKAAIPEKIVSNEVIIKTLPSGGKSLSLLNLDNFDLSTLGRYKSGEEFLLNEYISGNFGSRYYENKSRSKVFEYEKEYILSGKLSEQESFSYIKSSLRTQREALNTAHILSDSEKMEEAIAYAASIPTVGDPVEVAVIVALWATAETENDIRLLTDGKKVAFVKTKSQWALSLKKALTYLFTKEYVLPIDQRGQSYDDYLDAMLYAEDYETKLLRVGDLIQINLRTDYNSSFLLKEFYTGFGFSAQIDGKEYTYEQYY